MRTSKQQNPVHSCIWDTAGETNEQTNNASKILIMSLKQNTLILCGKVFIAFYHFLEAGKKCCSCLLWLLHIIGHKILFSQLHGVEVET